MRSFLLAILIPLATFTVIAHQSNKSPLHHPFVSASFRSGDSLLGVGVACYRGRLFVRRFRVVGCAPSDDGSALRFFAGDRGPVSFAQRPNYPHIVIHRGRTDSVWPLAWFIAPLAVSALILLVYRRTSDRMIAELIDHLEARSLGRISLLIRSYSKQTADPRYG